jgi:hypothetical protein
MADTNPLAWSVEDRRFISKVMTVAPQHYERASHLILIITDEGRLMARAAIPTDYPGARLAAAQPRRSSDVPSADCLISTLVVGGAHAQTATDVSDSKRVQVLQIREASATKQSLVKKSKLAATPSKKKAVQRNIVRQTKAAANEGAPATGVADDIR